MSDAKNSYPQGKENARKDFGNSIGYIPKSTGTSIVEKLGLPDRSQIKLGRIDAIIDPKRSVGVGIK